MAPETEFVVDTRPLAVVLLARSRPLIMMLIGAAIFTGIVTGTPPEGLSVGGHRSLAVFAICVFFWVFDVLPLMITSLLAIILLPMSGAMPAATVYALFGNEAVFFILGAFILAACLMRSRLSTRIALIILHRFGTSPRRLLITVLLLNATMSCIMSEHAVAAMNFPIVAEMVAVLGLSPRRSNYAKSLFLAMAWGTTIGGVATLLGGGRAPLALGILKEATGKTFTFLEWSLFILPLVIILLAVCYVVLMLFFPIDITSVAAADSAVQSRTKSLGRVRYQEIATGGVLVLTIISWIIGGEEFGLANIALAAVVAVFALQLVTWRDIEGYVNWGVLLMYGGAICLGAALNKSGAAAWMAQVTISQWATSGQSVVLLLSGLGILLTEALSNSAVVALMMPVSLGIADQFNLDPRVMALVIAVPAGLGYTLPIGTPANAIAYSSGYLSIRDMVIPGALLSVLSWLIFNAVANWYWPLLGLHIGAGLP